MLPKGRGRLLPLVSALFGIVLVAMQAIIDPSGVNVYCAIITAIASAVTISYCLHYSVIQRFPVSIMAVLGFGVTTYALPLIAQSFSGKPLVFNLLVPRETFEWTIAFQAVLLAAHVTYANLPILQSVSQSLARNVLRPLWIFRMPTVLELWTLGFMGISATWISRILYSDAVEFGNVGGKFLQALVPFIVVPFFIPFRAMFAVRPKATPALTTSLLAGYFVLVILTAVFFNARAIFAVIVFTILLAFFMMIAMRRLMFSSRVKVWMVIVAIAVIPLTSVAQDLATAMQIARGLRGSADPAEIAQATAEAFHDKEAIARFRKIEAAKTTESGFSGFSEIYLDSEFLQRLTYTKYTDLTMAASQRLTDFQRQAIRKDASDGIISILPTPIINFLSLDVDKRDRSFSTGDVYANLAFNQELGGYRSGSSITNSIDVLGQFWPLVIFAIAIIMFVLLDSYTLVLEGRLMISALTFVLMYQIFARGLVYDSFRELVDGVSRAYIQSLFVYVLLTLTVRILVAPLQAAMAGDRGRMRYSA